MRSAFNKEITRSIASSAGRFVAIAVISLLGAGFYAGLRMAAPDMRLGGDEFFDAANTYDLAVTTTLGVDDDTVALLADVEGVGAVMPTHRTDAIVSTGEGGFAAVVETLPAAAAESDTSDGMHALSDDEGYLNRPVLSQGAWPTSADECVVGATAAGQLGIAVGDELTVTKVSAGSANEDMGMFSRASNDAERVENTFAHTTFTVSGLVLSPLYVSDAQMGTTALGTGDIELYLLVDDAAFADDQPYSMAYLTVPAARSAMWDSPAYDQAVDPVKSRVESLADTIADKRYDTVKKQIRDELLGRMQQMTVQLGWSDDLERPEVYVMDRSKNPGMASLASDSDGITQIATFLPFLFFLVAALVSLTSMTRMVDEERLEIGTHKALGYGRARITMKYLVYGMLASGVGSAVGIALLGKLLPWFVLVSYATTYSIPTMPLPLDAGITAQALALSVGVTGIATWAAAAASLREKPAALMLPRAPKAGKRIFLERIRPLWARLSFSQKVTARNLLRYKRRFFMAVVGVAGCTALLLVGFGLRDAIGHIVERQYSQLMTYDMAVRIDDGAKADARRTVERLLDGPQVESWLAVDDFNLIAQGPSDDMRINVVVPSGDEPLDDYVTLRNRESGEHLSLDNAGIVLTEKAANQLGARVGDTVTLYDENDVGDKTGEGRAFTLAGVAENYLGHYAYLSPETYEQAFGEPAEYDMIYAQLAADPQKKDDAVGSSPADANTLALADELRAVEGVATVSFVADKMVTYENMLGIMDNLIVIIVALSAALAFVVLYNLTNINIGERIREIATLKVLGFTRGEVSAYIFREIVVMALLGALIGCVLGVPLTFYIAEAAETANMMFGRSIEPASFVFAFVITMAFTLIVAAAMRRKLARVDMVESLKSIE